MGKDSGDGRPRSQESYWGFGGGREADQDHIRKLAARQRERAASMRAEAAELRARNRLLRAAWSPERNGAIQRIGGAVGIDPRSVATSSD